MSTEAAAAPAAHALLEAARRNAALGHDNLGPLSEEYGFISAEAPVHDLPSPFDEWVAAADDLPELVRTLRLRGRLEALPLLDASAESLDDGFLLRAASVISLLSQAYANIPMPRAEQLPDQLSRPWLQISERLDRPPWTFNTIDFIFHNYRLIDSQAENPLRAENLALLNNVWDHPGVDRFMLVSFEVLSASTPLVGCAVRAQEACRRHDDDALKAALALAAETVRHVAFVTFPKISANAYAGEGLVDPVIWAKLFAMLPLPLKTAPDVLNASGIELPSFGLLDNLLSRGSYDSVLGDKARRFRLAYPRNWREFLAAVSAEPISDYVLASGDRELIGLFGELAEAYQGRYGMIARHRLQSFGYMDAAFKSGRPSTVTGFSGLFEERAWEIVDASFEAARLERLKALPPARRLARVVSAEELCDDAFRVVLDVRGLGLQCRPGDRLAVGPRNETELVARTLRALRATGHELVDLTPEWMEAPSLRRNGLARTRAPVRDVLAFGHIRPVPRATAKLLHTLTYDASLRAIIESRTEDQWELWDLLELMARSGFAPQRLWRAERGDYESLCRVVPPLQPRLYSVSGIEDGAAAAERIELTVGQLAYDSVSSHASVARPRRGTASTFLATAATGDELPVTVVRPVAFALPADPAVPIVMFAGGTGIAPFREFLRVRAAIDGTTNVLFACARHAGFLPYRAELEEHARHGRAELHAAYSRDPAQPRRVDELMRSPPVAARLRELVAGGAHLYVCGRATFSRTVMDVLAEILGGQRAIRELVARRRYLQDVFTTYTGSAVGPKPRIVASELSRHRSPHDGVWQAIAGRVYDLTEFEAIHPGGHKIIDSYAGMDATSSYRIVEHDRDPEVEAMLAMYEIGVMRRLEFGARFALAVGQHGLEHLPVADLYRRWVRTLYALVEISNAHRVDASVRDQPLRRDDDGTVTPYRLQFAIESHARFLTQTVPMVGRRFIALWRTTSGPCAAGADFRAAGAEFERLLAGPEAAAALDAARAFEHALEGDAARLADRIAAVTQADARYLESAAALLAAGVQAFETHGGDVLERDAEQLLAALRAFPQLTAALFDAVS